MSRTTPLLLAVALLATAFAGCITEPEVLDPNAGLPAPDPALTSASIFHSGNATLPDPGNLTPAVASLLPLGVEAFEPTMGFDTEGNLYYAAVAGGVAVGYKPLVMKSADGGVTWEDVSPTLPTGHAAPPETNDPYVYVDPGTGRVFQFAMAPILVCSVLSWSDDGGATWTTNPKGCGTSVPWDHQTMVAAAPRTIPAMPVYPNVLHQCVNSIAAALCSRSLDGGLTWSPGTPAFRGVEPTGVPPSLCGGLHGHVVASPDGVVYLPKAHCGVPMLAISDDDGLTWSNVVVAADQAHGEPDPAVAVDTAGNVYYAYIDAKGALKLSVSRDAGQTWSEPVVASPPGVVAHIPAIAAGDEGRVVLAYPGTEYYSDGYGSETKGNETWNGYLTIVEDALAESIVFQTVLANPKEDPLVRGACGPGRCPGMVDFIDVVIGLDGYPYASFVDACPADCMSEEDSGGSDAVVVKLTAGPKLVLPEEIVAEAS